MSPAPVKTLALPPRQALMAAPSLLPVLDRLDEAKAQAHDADSIQAVLEGFVMVEAVATERRLREQANRAEGGVTVLRARLGGLTPDGRKAGPGRGKHLPVSEGVLLPADHKERHVNKKLGKTVGEPKVAEVVEALVEAGSGEGVIHSSRIDPVVRRNADGWGHKHAARACQSLLPYHCCRRGFESRLRTTEDARHGIAS